MAADNAVLTDVRRGIQSEAASTSRFRGLEPHEVASSRKQFGSNVLTPPERDPWWRQFLEKFDDPVIRILMIAAVIAIAAGSVHGEYVEGVGIIGAILLATGLAFFNEYKANREFDILNQVNDEMPINVVRSGRHGTVQIRDVVVGDVVFVEAGEEIPADGTVLEAVSLEVVESALTGEPDANRKMAQGSGAAGGAIPADRVLRGTKVVDGHGVFEVTEVGDATEIGRTARAGVEETDEVTPLNAQLEGLSKVIGVVGLSVALATFAALVVRGVLIGELLLDSRQWLVAGLTAIGGMVAMIPVWLPMVYDGLALAGRSIGRKIEPPAWLDGDEAIPPLRLWLSCLVAALVLGGGGLLVAWAAGTLPPDPASWMPENAAGQFLQYFMIAVTIIVVAVPEGLAMSVTLSLAYSMRKMTASNTLVRKMDACETIGATTVICSDKTGTLTMNEMRVFEPVFPALTTHGLSTGSRAAALVVDAVAANTTAHLDRTDSQNPKPLGNPTEGALLMWLHDRGIDYVAPRTEFVTACQLTFSTERKFMATLGTSRSGERVVHVKGAPEIILGRCSQVLGPAGATDLGPQQEAIVASLRDYQARGMRTLAFAFGSDIGGCDPENIEPSVCDLTWLGFVAIADPIRPEVPMAIKACRAAGIRVKMVTGDNPDTAAEISRRIGLLDGEDDQHGSHVRGPDFAALDDQQAIHASSALRILSRAKPMDKVRLVRSLQAAGEVVAVTGDGINDCGALNHANVGLAMGRSGKAAAKEASDIILLDDSFGTIVHAVKWGRSLYENIQRFIMFQLTINVAALGIALVGPFIGVALPLTVIQMLWVNLIMDTFAALALATEPPHDDVMSRPPRDSQAFIITPAMARSIFGVGTVFLAVLVGMLLWMQRNMSGPDGQLTSKALSIFFSTFVMLQFWNLFNARCLGLRQSAFTGIWENRSLLLIAAAIFFGTILLVQFAGEKVFRTVPLTGQEWGIIIGATSLVLWFGEFRRWRARIATT